MGKRSGGTPSAISASRKSPSSPLVLRHSTRCRGLIGLAAAGVAAAAVVAVVVDVPAVVGGIAVVVVVIAFCLRLSIEVSVLVVVLALISELAIVPFLVSLSLYPSERCLDMPTVFSAEHSSGGPPPFPLPPSPFT